ncbi:PKD domain protein [Owenweeksia hongkongensis DSM 17368]|uniref:PKD domain protein n=1 Tax=Owenweeksia hongkongensis (strain DSM 17368 / CIP 108786 / JCM 12287 / NRRL B-23963 / UST20020801) TaxID=926562 RepID=G8R6G4_OWEHD|nr:LamG-like jellyroll fold domain-containing protein [Owenweeksia hongkongensis]AEV34427.1 PKD domain protein [Owenweeksia hongkongensis DSM 17368]
MKKKLQFIKHLATLLFAVCIVNSGYSQNALHFDGVDDYVQTTFPGILGGSTPITVEAWIKNNSGGNPQIITDWGANAIGSRFTFRLQDVGGISNVLRIEISGSGMNGTINVGDSTWHHVAVVYDPNATNNYTLYVDGVMDVQGNMSTSLNIQGVSDMRIGQRMASMQPHNFDGAMEEVRVWNVARTQAQLIADSATEFCQAQAGLVAYHRFNSGTAGGINTNDTISYDESGLSNNGQLHGFALSGNFSNWVTGKLTPCVPPSCLSPVGLGATNISRATADVYWTQNNAGSTFKVEYGTSGFTLGQGIKSASTNDTISLSGLTDLTTYDVYVKEICSATDSSAWSLFSFTTTCASLSGTYTVNKNAGASATNFTSFTDLANALSICGISGPLTVNVTPGSGVYNEQVEFFAIPGASATNTVTINGNGESIIDSGSTNYAALVLNGTDHIILDSLHIMAVGTSNRMALQFTNQADSNIVRNCVIEMDGSATATTTAALSFSGSLTSTTTAGNNGNYNLIEGNEISGGYYGVRHGGLSASSYIEGNQFIDNTIRDFQVYGLYSTYTTGTVIRGNDIHRLNRMSVSTFYGSYNRNSYDLEISNNWFHHGFAQATGSASAMYGVYSTSSDASVGSECKVFNNVFSDMDNSGSSYYIYNSGSDNWWYFHNTISTGDPTIGGTGATRMFYQTGSATGVKFKNNIVYMDRGTAGANYMLYLNSSSSYEIDNNGYYMPSAGTGNFNFGYYGGNISDLTAWKAVNSSAFDQNSAEGDPFFVDPSTGDYTPTAAYFNNIGDNLQTVVATDINGAARSTTPDPGAYEFIPPPGPDMSILNIYPGGASCGTTTDIIIAVSNQGTDTVNSYNVNYSVNGVTQTPIAMVGVFASGEVDSISITGLPISGSSFTSVVVTLTSIAPGVDTDPANNSGTIDLRAGLSGTYTLDQSTAASATNFVSFSSLTQSLMNYGVCGPVTVNLVGTSTTYTEQFMLSEIPGVSASNTVTINGNGNTLQFLATSSAERATVTLNGTDWLTIDSLNITALGSSGDYGFGVMLTNNADHNTIRNCIITSADDQTSTSFGGLTISGSVASATTYGQSGNYNTIEGNTIHGGYYGITCVGESSDSTNGNIIRNNIIEDFHYYGAYIYYNRDLEFSGNNVSRAGRTTTTTLYALRFYHNGSAKIVGNKIHDGFTGNPTSTSSSYYLYVLSMEGTASNPSEIANNLVYNTESEGVTFGMYFSNLTNTTIAHNTIALEDLAYQGTATYTYCRGVFFASTMNNVDFSNNLIYYDVNGPSGNGSCLVYASTLPSSMDNNAYYVGANTPDNFGYSGGFASTFSAWQSSTSQEVSSVFSNPYFTDLANDNFTPQTTVLDGMGADLTSIISEDINGVIRTIPTDPGAIEFTGAPCTGLLGITDTVTANSATVMWEGPGQNADIIWGPVGFMQASITPDTVYVLAPDTSGTMLGMNSNSCYEYYIKLNCTSSIPGAPALMGPYTVCTDCAGGGLNGTYTVGGTPGPSNFATLDSVIDALTGCGINGPVVFNLQGGTHNAFTLGNVDGSSATNTITFNGSANYGDSIIATGQTAAIELDRTAHVSFNGIYAENSGMYVVWMHNETYGVSFDNCHLMGNPSTSSLSSVLAATASATSATTAGNSVSHLNVSNCKITGNYYGVSLYGTSSASKSSVATLINNELTNQYYYGMRTQHMDSVSIEGNSVTGLRNASGSYGMHIYYTDNVEIIGNEVYGADNHALYVTYSNYSNSTPGSYSIIANNMLQSNSGSGIYVNFPENLDIFHNSIQGGGLYGMYLTGSSSITAGVDVRNNIIENSGTGTSLYVSTTPGNTTIDYNLYNSGGNIGNGEATLASWKTANTAWNQNSIQAAPGFVSANDFHIVGTVPNDLGDNTVGITVDFDSDTRPASGSTSVDIGADEYTPLSYDVTPDMIIAPLSGNCGDSNMAVSVVLTNLGVQPVTNVGVTVNVTGANTATLSGSYSGPLASLMSDTITISGFNSYMGGNFNFEVILSYTGDQNTNNDTLQVNGIEIISVQPMVYPIYGICTNDTTGAFAAVSQSGIVHNWYQNATDVTPFATGDTVSVSPNQTLFLDRSKEVDQLVVDAPHTSSQFGNMFKIYVKNDFTFTGFSFVPASSGTVEPIAFYKQGNFVGHETTRGDWTAIDSLTITGASANAWYRINFTSPVQFTTGDTISFYLANKQGTKIRWENITSLNAVGDLFFNNADFEYYAGVTGAYFGNNMTSGGPRAVSSIMHYSSNDVCGNNRIALTMGVRNDSAVADFTSIVNANGADVDFDASASKGQVYTWDFGDGQSGSGVNTTNTYGAAGSYTVTLTVTDTICGTTDTISKTVLATVSLTELSLSGRVEVYPNPNNGKFNVNLDLVGGQDVQLALVNTVGQVVYTKDLGRVGGHVETELHIENLAPGVYYLRVMANGKSTTVKITVL